MDTIFFGVNRFAKDSDALLRLVKRRDRGESPLEVSILAEAEGCYPPQMGYGEHLSYQGEAGFYVKAWVYRNGLCFHENPGCGHGSVGPTDMNSGWYVNIKNVFNDARITRQSLYQYAPVAQPDRAADF